MTRSNAREIACHLVYEMNFNGITADEAMNLLMDPEYYPTLASETEIYAERPSGKQAEYLAGVVHGVEREREALEAQPGEQTISVSQSKSAYEGLFIYTGTFEDLTPDKDTPVYAVLGGVCYEACPTEAGFQLLTPAGSGLSLLVCMDGVYQCLQATIE